MENLTEKMNEAKPQWQIPTKRAYPSSSVQHNIIPTHNRFTGLENEPSDSNTWDACEEHQTQQNNRDVLVNQQQRRFSNSDLAFRRNGFPIDQHPERNVSRFGGKKNHSFPTHSTYSDIVRNGKKKSLSLGIVW